MISFVFCGTSLILSCQSIRLPPSAGGEWKEMSLGGSPIAFPDKASGGLQRRADVIVMQSMTRVSQQERQGVLELVSR